MLKYTIHIVIRIHARRDASIQEGRKVYFYCLIVNSESVYSARSLFFCLPQAEGIVGTDCVVLLGNGRSCGAILDASVDDLLSIFVGCPTVVLLLQPLLPRNIGEMERVTLSSMCNATYAVCCRHAATLSGRGSNYRFSTYFKWNRRCFVFHFYMSLTYIL